MTEPLFHCAFPVSFHAVKKNGKSIFKSGGRVFVGSNKRVKAAEEHMLENLLMVKLAKSKTYPITEDIGLEIIFTFNDFYTKKGERRKNLPDLSNLIELPQDCLQKIGIIENDTQVCSLDGCRRRSGESNTIEIYIWSTNDF